MNKQIVCTTWDPPLSLEQYVQNGLQGEWYGSWDSESLKAGAVAYRSYGAWYVAHPLSSNYDICDTASCQIYNPVAYGTSKKTTAAVTATAGVVLVRPDPATQILSIIKAEYAAESNLAADADKATCSDGSIGEPNFGWPCMTDFVCTTKTQANTHSRGMCQRGTQRWASGKDSTGAPGDTGLAILNSSGVAIKPRDWRCIVNHYYNASNSITVDPSMTATAGTGDRTAFMQSAPTYGSVAYQDASTSPTTIRVASAADGSGDRLLTTGVNPTWAPGGDKLAYHTGSGLSVINADGSGARQITANTGVDFAGNPKYDFNPAWSPVGDKIAFCSTRSGSGVDVWIVNSDGTALAQVTNGLFQYNMGVGGGYPCYLSWSPDGTKIAFTGDTAYVPFPGSGAAYNIYTMYADGSGVTQLTDCVYTDPHELQSVCAYPSWSPDGTKIAFEDDDAYGDTIGGGGLYTMNSDGSLKVHVFITSPNSYSIGEQPHWSADGQRLIFLSNQPGGNWGIWSMNADGTSPVQIIGGAKSYKYYPVQIDCSRCANFNN